MAMNPFFARAVTGALSDSISKLHDERLKKTKDEEEHAKALYTTLLQSGNPEISAAGLAGLSELAGNPKAAKNALKITETFRKFPKHAEAAQVINGIHAQQAPPPEPPPAMTPPVEGDEETGAGSPNMTGPAPTVSGPPPTPVFSSPAAGNATNPTQQGTNLNLTPTAGVQAGPPSPPPEVSPRQEFFNQDPLAPRTAYTPELQAASAERRATAHDDASLQRMREMSAAKIAATAATAAAKNQPYTLTGTEAQLAGVPDGTTINPAIFTKLFHEGRADYRAAISASTAKYSADRRADAAENAIVPIVTTDAEGRGTTTGMRKRDLLGSSIERPAPAQAQNKAHQARVIMQRGDELIQKLQANPQMGPIIGRIAKGEIDLGSVDPETRSLYTALESFTDLQPALHGSRGVQYAERFKKAIGGLETNPAAVIASVRELQKTAQDFQDEVAPRKKPGGPPSPPGEVRRKRYNPATGMIE